MNSSFVCLFVCFLNPRRFLMDWQRLFSPLYELYNVHYCLIWPSKAGPLLLFFLFLSFKGETNIYKIFKITLLEVHWQDTISIESSINISWMIFFFKTVINYIHHEWIIRAKTYKHKHKHMYIDMMVSVFANGLGEKDSVPVRVIPKTQKWFLMPHCLTLWLIKYESKVSGSIRRKE